MAAPVWFDYKAYFNNKLALLNESDSVFDSLGGGYNDLTLKAAFEAAGYSVDADGLYQHFVDFGNAEGISPNAWFNTEEYLYNKAADYFNSSSVTPQMVESMRLAMMNSGMSAWDHYDQYWAESYEKDGSFNNPSTSFDVSAYMNAKLAQMQAENPGYTMDELVADFVASGLSPVEHYLEFGAAEGIVPTPVTDSTGNTYQLTEATDTLYGTSGNDFFNAELGSLLNNDSTLNSADYIDGMGGNDTLYARVEGADGLEPTIVNVENIFFQSQGTAAGSTIDADRISLADGQTLTLGSVNSRDHLVIDDVRHNSNETVIRFQDADPAVQLTVYFNPKYIVADDAVTTGSLYLQLIDTVGAAEARADSTDVEQGALRDNPYTGFKFTLNGKDYTVNFGAYNSGTDETPTYAELAAQIQAAIDADSELSGLGLTVSLGGSFSAVVGIGDHAGETVTGTQIVLSTNQGALVGGDWIAANGLPSTNSTSATMADPSVTTCPLTSTTLELSGVGHMVFEDNATCLPNLYQGSSAGAVIIGANAAINGVERIDVKMDEASWISSLASTNEALRMVTVAGQDIDGDGVAENGNLYIGTWAGRGELDGDGTNLTWTDAATLLQTGLTDVAVFDAADYTGNINIAAEFTASSYNKYLQGDVDGAENQGNPPVDGYDGFVYNTGSGSDVVNMTVNGDIAADNDFDLTISTGAGDDLVAFRYDDMDVNQSLNQKNLQNVSIATGDGNDTVWFYGDQGGSAVIEAGSGNDVIYANQEESFTGGNANATTHLNPNNYNAVFVFNTSDTSVGIAGHAGATLQNNMAIGQNLFTVNNAAVGETLQVSVDFLGYTGTFDMGAIIADMTLSAEDLNHAIIKAIQNSDTLSALLSAKDGAGHSLIIESLINGQYALNDLAITFNSVNTDGIVTGGAITDLGTWYNTQYGTDNTGANFDGNSTTTSQVVVDGGAGDDIIVLGPNGTFMDVVNQGSGNDKLVGFDVAHDRINLYGVLDAGKALNTGATAAALADNAVVILNGQNATAEDGVFTQAEIQTLLQNGTLTFAGADAASAVVYLKDLDSNVYTVVKLSYNGSAASVDSIIGSLTLDDNSGALTAAGNFILEANPVLQNGVYPGSTFDLGAAGQATTGGPGDDIFNITGAYAAAASGGAGNDTFNVSAALGAATLNGDAGDDEFSFTATQTAAATINGGDGNDTFVLGGTMTDFGTLLIDGGMGTNIVEITSTGNVNEDMTNLSNITSFVADAAATGTLTLDLSAATAGMTVDTAAKTTGTVTITTSAFGDTITLNGDNSAVDTITLTANTSGVDTITGFKANEDELKVNNLGGQGTVQNVNSAAAGGALDLSTNTVYLISASGDAASLTTGGSATLDLATQYTDTSAVATFLAERYTSITTGTEAVFLLQDSDDATITYIYALNDTGSTGTLEAGDITLVGTVTSDAAIVTGDIAVA